MKTPDLVQDRPPLGDRAKELAADAGKEALARANEQGERGMHKLGDKLDKAARYVDVNVGEQVEKGDLPLVKREDVDKVAGGMRKAADYLRENDPSSLLHDVDGAIKRHPYRAMAIGLGVGYLLGRFLRSRD